MVISKTAKCYGWGSDRWKGVSGLTKGEKQAILNGELVFIPNCKPSYGKSGSTYRIAIVNRYRNKNFWKRRVLTETEENKLAEYLQAGIVVEL